MIAKWHHCVGLGVMSAAISNVTKYHKQNALRDKNKIKQVLTVSIVKFVYQIYEIFLWVFILCEHIQSIYTLCIY